MSEGTYEGVRRVAYQSVDDMGIPIFVPVCAKVQPRTGWFQGCGRFVKADDVLRFNVKNDNSWAGPVLTPREPNATCKKCGRTSMLFEGFF